MVMKTPKTLVRTFSAVLTRSGNTLNWVTIRIPFDAAKIWGRRGALRVKGEINGFAFKTSLFPTGDGHHFMVVNKQLQKGARVHAGMQADFRMEPDFEERVIAVVPELDRALRVSKRLQKFYQSLPPSTKQFVVRFVSQAKQPQTRSRRAEQVAEHLMETMEAENELPPMIRLALARNPEAAERWQRMTLSQRRSHLLGIFGSRNPQSRQRRIEKAVAQMIEPERER
jgi:uncharacterized protein YdeI (YjbR/CyaY-like superfamily)